MVAPLQRDCRLHPRQRRAGKACATRRGSAASSRALFHPQWRLGARLGRARLSGEEVTATETS
eukprot:8303257-Prorocentrum_lima.AAC.1